MSDAMPGISRRSKGKGFEYRDTANRVVNDERDLSRIRSLAIPPAYQHVWICPYVNGHIQATGRDARGRKQYRYHPRWREARDATKYERMLDFAKALPRIRKRVAADLKRPGLPREKVLATVLELLESTLIRVGNEEYARENGSFGLTTLENRHASVRGETVRFSFRGKSGIKHAISLHDRRLARIVRQCQELPGQHLFSYVGDEGETHAIDSSDVNDYLREIAGDDFTAKDFRTWVGSVNCLRELAGADGAESVTERKARVVEAIACVAKRLGNTPAVCRKCYVHPKIIERFLEGKTLGDERELMRLLKRG